MDYIKDGTLTIQARTIKEVNSIDRVVVYADGCQREYLMPLPEVRKEGEWKISSFTGNWYCSICGNEPYHSNLKNMNYCPNCGARMKGE